MEDLVKHLISNGIEEDTANKIAASYEAETVDTEQLQKALENVAEVMRDAGTQTNEEITKRCDFTINNEKNYLLIPQILKIHKEIINL